MDGGSRMGRLGHVREHRGKYGYLATDSRGWVQADHVFRGVRRLGDQEWRVVDVLRFLVHHVLHGARNRPERFRPSPRRDSLHRDCLQAPVRRFRSDVRV